MNKAKKDYKSKCKTRTITFYLHEKELYNFSKTINFQAFIKLCLKNELRGITTIKNKYNRKDN